jgi:hypothetical protein
MREVRECMVCHVLCDKSILYPNMYYHLPNTIPNMNNESGPNEVALKFPGGQ